MQFTSLCTSSWAFSSCLVPYASRLMMNLLLAIFYSNFKTRFSEKIDRSEKKRSQYLYDQFTKIGGNKGYLTEFETYKLFVVIHSLVTQTKQDIFDDSDDIRHQSHDLQASFR